jgi:hypothetical protein
VLGRGPPVFQFWTVGRTAMARAKMKEKSLSFSFSSSIFVYIFNIVFISKTFAPTGFNF